MRSRQIEPDLISYNSAILACAKSQQTQRALDLLSEMESRGVMPEDRAYNAAISACTNGNDILINLAISQFRAHN